MKRRTKVILWAFTAAVLLFLVLSAAAAGYVYRHPDRIKDVVARSVSQALGLKLRIHRLVWSHDPLHLRLEGVTVVSQDSSDGTLHLAVQTLRADMSVEGGFGDRILVVDRALARGVDLVLQGKPPLSRLGHGNRPAPSWMSRAGTALVKWLLFQDVRIEQAELQEARTSVHVEGSALQVSQLEASIAPDRAIRASCGVQLSHREGRLLLDLPSIEAEFLPPADDNSIEGRLEVSEGILKRNGKTARGISLQGGFTLDAPRSRIRINSLDVHLPDPGPLLPAETAGAPAARLQGSGVVLLEEQRFEDGIFRVTLQRGNAELEMKGRANGTWGPSLQGTVKGLECRFRPWDWTPLLPGAYKASLEPLHVSGSILISGGMEARLDQEGFHFTPDLMLRLADNTLSLSSPPLEAGARLNGDLRIRGPWPESTLSGRIQAVEVEATHPAARIFPSEAVIRLDGRPDDIHFQEATLRVPGLQITGPKGPLTLNDLRLRMTDGRLDPYSFRLTVPDLALEAEGIGPVQVEGTVRKGRVDLSAEGENTGALPLLSQAGWPLEGWNMKGSDSLRIRVDSEDSGTWALSLQTEVTDFSFENSPLEAFGEGLSFSLDADMRSREDGGLVLESSTAKAWAGEALVDRFYLNLDTNPISAHAGLRMDLESGTLHHAVLDAELGGVLSIRASGSLFKAETGLQADMDVSIPTFPLKPAFRLFVVEPFRMEIPVLKHSNLEGRGAADLQLRTNPEGFLVSGDVHIRDATLNTGEETASVEGVNLSLPICYGTLSDDRAQSPRKGSLSIRTLSVPFLPQQSLSLNLGVYRNRIHIPDPTMVRIPGGTLRLGPLDLAHHMDRGLHMATSLHLANVDLRPLLDRVWPDPPKGRIGGRLNSIRFQDGLLTSEGVLHAEVFNGRATVQNLGASGLFSSAPTYRFDARLEGMDLEQMTAGTAFGRITGILEARLTGFELAYGQPQRFDLLMETIPREGVEQRVSVKAVDNIARIGGGSSPFVGLAGLFTSLFQEFPYERIGIHAVLENDIFRINGTIHEGGTEYLIKRSGISGVNIVNQNPDNRIRFKDMVKRIQRVTSSHGSPVVR